MIRLFLDLRMSAIIYLRIAASEAQVRSSDVQSRFVTSNFGSFIESRRVAQNRYSNSIVRFGVPLLSSLVGLQNTTLACVRPVYLEVPRSNATLRLFLASSLS